MDDDWDDTPSGNSNVDETVDTGRNFSRGRGFSKQPSDDGEWGSEDTWGSNTRGGRGGGHRGGFDRNGNSDRGRGGRGRGGSRGGFRNNGDGDSWGNGDSKDDDWGGGSRRGGRGHDSWGNDEDGGDRGSRRGGRGRGGFRNKRDDDDSWGGGDGNDEDGGGGGRGRGRGRGGFRNKRDDDDSWGGDGHDEDGGGGGGRGRGRGRGGFRNKRDDDNNWGGEGKQDGGEDGEEQPEKPRENYIPPEPSNDESELFGTSISSGINFNKYDNIPVKVTGTEVVPAINSFEESGLREILLENIRKSGYTKPTPIQKVSLPIILAGRDIMACAQTGSGKTAAFLLPIINDLLENKTDLVCEENHCEPQAVIVSPTRELAIQIWTEARKFAHDSVIKTVVTYGGTNVRSQIDKVMKGCHILVATPGRMNDFVERNIITFNSIRYVVLDEADRMLDMGFLPSIEQMMNHPTMVPTSERQTLMYSATFPESVQELAGRFLNNYLFITIGIVGGACSDVSQIFYKVGKFEKRKKLIELIKEAESARILVFIETKRNADFIATYLSELNISSTSIHGDRLQSQREEALRDFKNGRRNVLVATDVAARGLDIKNVEHVINYDLPKSIDEYVHRIGRTGRVGNRGKASSFFDSEKDAPLAADLLRILKQANQTIPDWLESAAGGGGGSYSSDRFGGRDVRGDSYGQHSAQVQVQEEEEW